MYNDLQINILFDFLNNKGKTQEEVVKYTSSCVSILLRLSLVFLFFYCQKFVGAEIKKGLIKKGLGRTTVQGHILQITKVELKQQK